jgi:hypothetical protein
MFGHDPNLLSPKMAAAPGLQLFQRHRSVPQLLCSSASSAAALHQHHAQLQLQQQQQQQQILHQQMLASASPYHHDLPQGLGQHFGIGGQFSFQELAQKQQQLMQPPTSSTAGALPQGIN